MSSTIIILWLLALTVVAIIANQSSKSQIRCFFDEAFNGSSIAAHDYERWLKHVIRLFPDGGLALVDSDGIITECSVGFAQLVSAATTAECIGRCIDSFHVDPNAARELRLSMRQDIIGRPVSFCCVDGQCKMVALSVFDLKGIWLVRLVESV